MRTSKPKPITVARGEKTFFLNSGLLQRQKVLTNKN